MKIRVIDFHLGGTEVRDIKKALPADVGGGHALVDGAVRAAMVGMVDFQNGVGHARGRIRSRVPAGNRAILRGKDENGLFARCYLEVRWAAVEYYACWCGLRTGSKAWRRNHDEVVERAVNTVAVGIRMRIGEGVWRDSCPGVERRSS